MAKKDNDLDFEDDDFGLDDELGNLDFGDGGALPPPKNAREAVTRSLKDVGSGIIGSVTDNPLETATTMARKSIPKEIDSEVNDIIDVVSSTKDAMKEAVDDVKKTSAETVKNISKLLPKGGTIGNMLDKIYNKLGGEDDKQSGPTKEQIENANIADSIVGALGEQNKLNQVNELIRASTENSRHQTATQIMSTIAAENEQIRKFHYEITNSFYRKSLELQYKSLFVQKESLEVTKTGMARFTNQLESIVANTGLPDILKARNSERLKETLKQEAYDGIKDTIYKDFNPLQNLKANLVKRIKDEAGAFKDGLDGINAGLEQAGMMFGDDSEMGDLLGDSKSRMVGGMLGTFIRDNIFGRIGNRVGKTNAGKNLIKNVKNFGADTKTGLRNLSRNLENTPVVGGALSGAANFLTDMVGDPEANKVVINKKDMDGAALFDGRTQDSIVKVIPGLLAKILAQVTYISKGGMRGGKKAGKADDYELNYNFDTGSYENVKDVVGNVNKQIKNTLNEKITYKVADLLKLLSTVAKKTMSKPLRNILDKLIVDEMFDPKGMFSSDLFTSKKFVAKIPEPEKSEYIVFIKEYDKQFKKLSADNTSKVTDKINNMLKDIKFNLPNVSKYANNLNSRGLGDKATELGWTSYNEGTGQEEIDNKKIRNNLIDKYNSLTNEEKSNELIRRVGIENYKAQQLKEAEKAKETMLGKTFNKASESISSAKDKLTKKEKDILEQEKRDNELNNSRLSAEDITDYYGKGGFTGKGGKRKKDKTGKEPAGIVHTNEAVIPEDVLTKYPFIGKIFNMLVPNKKVPKEIIDKAESNTSEDTNKVAHEILEAISPNSKDGDKTKDEPKAGDKTNEWLSSFKSGFKSLGRKETYKETYDNAIPKAKQVYINKIDKLKNVTSEYKQGLKQYIMENEDTELMEFLDKSGANILDFFAKKGEHYTEKIFGSVLAKSFKESAVTGFNKTVNTFKAGAEKVETGTVNMFNKASNWFGNNDDITKEEKPIVNNEDKPKYTVGDAINLAINFKESFEKRYDGLKSALGDFYERKQIKGIKVDVLSKDISELFSSGKSKITNITQEDLLKLSDALVVGGEKAFNFLKENDFGDNANNMVNAVLNFNVKNGATKITDNVTGKISSTLGGNKYISDELVSIKDVVDNTTKRLKDGANSAKNYYTDYIESNKHKGNTRDQFVNKTFKLGAINEETFKKIRAEFFSSEEWKNKDVTNLREYLRAVHELDETTIDHFVLRTYNKKLINEGSDLVKKLKPKTLLDNMLREARPIEELKAEFFDSPEFKNKQIENFYHWIDVNGYKIKDEKTTIRRIFEKARELDRKIFKHTVGAGAKLLGKTALGTVKGVGSLALGTGRLGANAVGGLYNAGRRVSGLNVLPKYKHIEGAGSGIGNVVGKTLRGTLGVASDMFGVKLPFGFSKFDEQIKHQKGLDDYYEDKKWHGLKAEYGEGKVEAMKKLYQKDGDLDSSRFKNKADAELYEKTKEIYVGKPKNMYNKMFNKSKSKVKSILGKVGMSIPKFLNAPVKLGNKIRRSVTGAGKNDEVNDAIDTQAKFASSLLGGTLDTISKFLEKRKKKEEKGERKGSWKDRLKSFVGMGDDKKQSKTLSQFFKDNKKGLTITAGLLGIAGLLKVMNVSFEDVKDFGKGLLKGFGVVKDVLVNIYNVVKPIVGAVIDMGKWIGEGIGAMAGKVGGWIKKLIPDWLLNKFGGDDKPEIGPDGQPIDPGSSSESMSAGEMTAYGLTGYAGYKVAKGIYSVGSKVVGGVKLATNVVKGGVNLAKGGANLAAKVVDKANKKGIAKKILSILKSFKNKILKKIGPKAAVKVLGGLAGKIAARAVPIIGWGVLLYDAAMVIKYMAVDKLDLKSAVSKAVLGFDLFNDDESVLDADGNPIKPDEKGVDDVNSNVEIGPDGQPIDPESTSSATTAGEMTAYGLVGYAAYKARKGIISLGSKLAGVVKGGANVVKGGADLAVKAAEKLDKKGIASKIIGILKSFKEKILKKIGPKAAIRVLGELAGKIAARAVPIVGWGVLIYDAAMVIKYMTVDGLDLKSAVSKSVLGFDLFNDDEPVLDADGNPIKPDELVDEEKIEENIKKEEETAEEKEKRLKSDKYVSKDNMDKLFNSNNNSTTPETKKEDEPTGLMGWFKKIFGQASSNLSAGYDSAKERVSAGYEKVKEVGGAIWDKIKNASIGAISAYFESGNRGPGTVSSGNGDFGGVSYGTHQLASKTGTLRNYLKSSKYGPAFNGLVPGSPQFSAKWKEIAAKEPVEFGHDQEEFIKRTHYMPQVNRLSKSGMDVTSRSEALQSAVYSAAVQFGPSTGLINNALAANNIDHTADDETIIKSIYKYKKDNNDKLFKSSSAAVRKSTLNRARDEESMVLKKLKEDMSKIGVASVPANNVEDVKPTTDTAGTTNTSTDISTASNDIPPIDKNTLTASTENIGATNTTTVNKEQTNTTSQQEVTLSNNTPSSNNNTTTIDKSSTSIQGLSEINATLVRSLETQLRMADTLDRILEVSGSRNLSPDEAKKIAGNKTPNKKTSDVPQPVVNLSKSA